MHAAYRTAGERTGRPDPQPVAFILRADGEKGDQKDEDGDEEGRDGDTSGIGNLELWLAVAKMDSAVADKVLSWLEPAHEPIKPT